MAASFGRSDDAFGDPFDAVLSTARRIGFEVPEHVRSCDDLERSAHFGNLRQLVKAGREISDLQAALFAEEQNTELHGFFDTRELRRLAHRLQKAIDVLDVVAREKLRLVQWLTRDDLKNGVPVELDGQTAFQEILHAVARDKYKLCEMAVEARACVELNAPPLSWRPQLESLKSVLDAVQRTQQDVEAAGRLVEAAQPPVEAQSKDAEMPDASAN